MGINKEQGTSESIALQRKIKQEIMDKVIPSIFLTLNRYDKSFTNEQPLLDIIFSVLIMINREVLSRLIYASGSELHTKRILKDLFKAIENEVRKRLEAVKQHDKTNNNYH